MNEMPPGLLPEELLNGYRGRLRLPNGLRDGVHVNAWLNGLEFGSPRQIARVKPFVALVAKHNRSTTYEIVVRHTLWPFTAAVGRVSDPAAVDDLAYERSARTAMMRTVRPHAWFCQACVEEDLDFWGLSYWRRSVQLPGAVWCDKHLSPLCFTSLGAMDSGPPHHFLDGAESADSSRVEEAQSNPFVRSFVEICAGILDAGLVLHRGRCADAIWDRSSDLRTASPGPAFARELVSRALECLPHWWLQVAFPKINWSRPEAVMLFTSVFGSSSYPASSSSMALAASLMFTSSDEALAALGRETPSGSNVTRVDAPWSRCC